MTKPPIVIAHDVQTFRIEDSPDQVEAEIAAILERMHRPLSRERQVATELELYLEVHRQPVSDDDWLAFARHMIETVTHARDLSAEDVEKAMNSPLAVPLPDFDDL